jgi:tRNA pseudouridine32 synthase/23S rRNA pseudouridine746 synthase
VARVIASRLPLPMKDGVGASVIVVPADASTRYASLLDFLDARFPNVAREVIAERIARGEVCDANGGKIDANAYALPQKLYYYRSIPDEPSRFGDVDIVFEDEWLVVADKPHFMPVTPGGKYLNETLIVQLRRRTGVVDLAPMHRIDRETAGLVAFTKQPQTRGRYQSLFETLAVSKAYECVAPTLPALSFPMRAAHRIAPGAHFMQMRVEEGEPNAFCEIDVDVRGDKWSRYRLAPLTGKKHQLRVQMAALGIPIRGDQIYPTMLHEPHEDPARALALLAREIQFVDPMTGESRVFRSRRPPLTWEA